VTRPNQEPRDTPLTDELPAVWRRQAAELRQWAAAESAAVALERAADQLDDALRRQDDEPLTLMQAAAESGYSVDHLGRQISRGKIPNVGRRNAPRVRRADLPKKSTALRLRTRASHIGREEIARAVINRHVGGA